jgi:D-alanyl-lipoteichoic acid acyltransferase DltB (MBOAT superfamily)
MGGRMPKLLGIVLVFLFVTLGWAFFVTSSLGDSLLLLAKVFS